MVITHLARCSSRATAQHVRTLVRTEFGRLSYIAINSGGSQVAQQQWSGSGALDFIVRQVWLSFSIFAFSFCL